MTIDEIKVGDRVVVIDEYKSYPSFPSFEANIGCIHKEMGAAFLSNHSNPEGKNWSGRECDEHKTAWIVREKENKQLGSSSTNGNLEWAKKGINIKIHPRLQKTIRLKIN